MAPSLTSNSFLLTTTPHSRLTRKTPRFFTVFAKKSASFPSFKLNKSSSNDVDTDQESNPGNPFKFDFGKLPDVTSLIPVSTDKSPGLSFGNQRRKDAGTVFVAGASGQAGIRIAQTLLRQGFSVRAGVPDLAAAQELARLASKYKLLSNDESKRINAVESTFQDSESIAKAIGNASKVVVTIGPAENGPTGEVTTADALQVIQAAQLANVGHVAIVYDGGSSSGSSTNNVLDGISSFFNNLFSRSQPLTIDDFLQRIIETDLSYTLIKTKLTEDFSPESSYNVVVSPEGNAGSNDYKVAKSRIALLVADIFSNTAVAENKVVEVYTDPSASLKTIDELFSAIPEDKRRKEYLEVIEKEKAEEAAKVATVKAREAAKAAEELKEEVDKLKVQEARAASLADEAQEMAKAAGTSVDSLLAKAKDMSSGLSWEKFSSQIQSAVQNASEEPKVKIATMRGQAKARNLTAQKAVVKKNAPKTPPAKSKAVPKPEAQQAKSKPEVRNVFGGLFKQETIYVDDV